MKPTNFKTPKTDKELRVKYRNGQIDNYPRKVEQMRWDETGSDWDIIEAEFWK